MPKRNRGPHLHFRADRDRWVIRWFERGRQRQRATGFGRGEKSQAERALGLFLLGRETDGPRDPVSRRIADVLAGYAAEHGPTTAVPYQIALRVETLVEYWGTLTVDDITEEGCRAYLEWRRTRTPRTKPRPASAGTCYNDLLTLGAAINHDYRRGRLTRPVHVWKPPRGPSRDRWLTRAELAALLRAARRIPRSRRTLPLFILTAYYLAGRKQAILDLRWPQIDLERGIVDLNPPGRARTGKGRPALPLPNRLATFLRYARRRGTATGYVFTTARGPLREVRKGFARAVREAGIEGKVTPHDLRRTAATHMAEAGVDMRVISLYLGHTSIAITERVYARYSPNYLDAARRFFDRKPAGY